MRVVLAVEAYQQGTNLGRLEGYRLIVESLGGKVDAVSARPTDDEWWHLDITLRVPRAGQARVTALAPKIFDGQVKVTEFGTAEGGDDE